MRKRVKILVLLVALLVVGILAAVYGGFRMFKDAPEWYRHPNISPAQRELLARQAMNKFTNIQNAAALARRNEKIAQSTSSLPAPEAIEVSFSDDELNAFFEKWASYANWKSNYDRYVDYPLIIIQKDHLTLAGQVKELSAVLSLEFEPRIDAAGKLDLHLERVLAGLLPLPDFFMRGYRGQLKAGLQSSLPRWRSLAAIDSDGAANGDLISASMARLCMHALDHTSADPVLFLPLVERGANVPVRVCALKVEDHNVTMTVIPLNSKERAALLERIQAEEPTVP